MDSIILAAGGLSPTLSYYLPLIVVCIVLALVFLIFKLVGVSAKILWKILINSLVGAAMLCLFDIVFYMYLHMNFFYIPVTWFTSAVAGVLGVPGVIILLALKFIIPLP